VTPDLTMVVEVGADVGVDVDEAGHGSSPNETPIESMALKDLGVVQGQWPCWLNNLRAR